MLRTLKDLFDKFTLPERDASAADIAHDLKLASAVLLVDVMRADADTGPAERSVVIAALKSHFDLGDDELARLVELSEQTAQSAYDYHRFTSQLNEHLTHDQKVCLVENMWQVAYADAHLDAHENHLISKVAGLLHVTHGEYIAAKLHAKTQRSRATRARAGMSGLAFDQAVDHQQDDGADHGRQEACRLTRGVPAHGRAGVAGEERAGDAEDGGHDPAEFVVAGFHGARQKADDQANDDGADDGHVRRLS